MRGIYAAILRPPADAPVAYIGKSRTIEKRWEQHETRLRKGNHHCALLQEAYDQCSGALEWRVLLEVPGYDEEELAAAEEDYIAQFIEMYGSGRILNTARPSAHRGYVRGLVGNEIHPAAEVWPERAMRNTGIDLDKCNAQYVYKNGRRILRITAH